jgi:hypothetical protein
MKRYSPRFDPSSKVLLIVPPFANIRRPSYGVHLLQAAAREQGCEVSLLYANILLVPLSGERNYEIINAADCPRCWERCFLPNLPTAIT